MKYEFDKDLNECVVLSVGTNAPPRFRGGLDHSMWSVATRLSAFVKKMHLVSAAESSADVYDDEIDGVAISRRLFPRPYPATEHGHALLKKLQFQVSDHLHPENVRMFSQCLDEVRPDIVLVHSLVGVGFNVIAELARRNLRVVFYLHELGLVCINRAMYRNGSSCTGQCFPCVLSSRYQQYQHSHLKHVAYISPSNGNLAAVRQYFDIGSAPAYAILNANAYPIPVHPRGSGFTGTMIFTFVGRVDREKGVGFVLDVFAELSKIHDIRVNIVGDGAELPMLRARYENAAWCTFHGWKTQEEVAGILGESDLMVAPSLWTENSPGVVAHSLLVGTPVVASEVGGMLDLVQSGINGVLVPVGDRDAWIDALGSLMEDRSFVETLRLNARNMSGELSADRIFEKHKAAIENTRYGIS